MSNTSTNEPAARPTPDLLQLYERWKKVHAKMETAKPHLLRGGSVVRRRISLSRDVWVIRYRERVDGRVAQRSIYLGSPAIAVLARRVLAAWREAAVTPEQRRRDEVLWSLDLAARSRDYSARARRRLRNAAVKTLDDPRKTLEFLIQFGDDDRELRHGGSPGRPRRSGLW